MLIFFIGFILVKAIFIFTVLYARKIAQHKEQIVTFNRRYQVPCKSCRFFSNNHYLNCAVHPSVVLTQQALNCSDYWYQDCPDQTLPVTSVVSATVFDPQTQSWHRLSDLFEHSETVWTVAPFLRPHPSIASSTSSRAPTSKLDFAHSSNIAK